MGRYITNDDLGATIELPEPLTVEHWCIWWDVYHETLEKRSTQKEHAGVQTRARLAAAVRVLISAVQTTPDGRVNLLEAPDAIPLRIGRWIANEVDQALYEEWDVPKESLTPPPDMP